MLDKTSTLTYGHLTVTKAIIFVDKSVCLKAVFLAAVRAAESNSEHWPSQNLSKKFVSSLSCPFSLNYNSKSN